MDTWDIVRLLVDLLIITIVVVAAVDLIKRGKGHVSLRQKVIALLDRGIDSQRRKKRARLNTRARTVVTEGYLTIGPFKTEEQAWYAPISSPHVTVQYMERRDDGWYKVYATSTSTTLWFSE